MSLARPAFGRKSTVLCVIQDKNTGLGHSEFYRIIAPVLVPFKHCVQGASHPYQERLVLSPRDDIIQVTRK